MTRRQHILAPAAAGAAAALMLSGCTIAQDTFQVGQREFTYASADEAEGSRESFRFQGFLPDDATDIRLVAQLDGDQSVMQWVSPTPFASEHCEEGEVTSEPDPELEADWLPGSLPTEGYICDAWTVVRSGDTQYAWPERTSS